jgi:hypothetical protein
MMNGADDVTGLQQHCHVEYRSSLSLLYHKTRCDSLLYASLLVELMTVVIHIFPLISKSLSAQVHSLRDKS